jgi:MerR family transcriptional regulator, redox-sensitive transcriptional activator SoxR
MAGMTIGEVARRVGLSTSALRYYEKAGLLPAPARSSQQRRYDNSILGRIRIIQLARAAGFTIRETRQFVSGFPSSSAPALRWRAMATKKLAELDSLLHRVTQMKTLLEAGFRCECRQLEDCERLLAQGKPRGPRSAA